jgi:hypothetical protein
MEPACTGQYYVAAVDNDDTHARTRTESHSLFLLIVVFRDNLSLTSVCFQLLPLCTATEWKTLAHRLKGVSNMDTTSPVLIHCFADSVLLLLLVIEREGFAEDDCALSCLDYCVRNLGLILKVCYS